MTWSGNYLVNPWNVSGLVDLQSYPKLAAYFEQHRSQLQGRHVGKKTPSKNLAVAGFDLQPPPRPRLKRQNLFSPYQHVA